MQFFLFVLKYAALIEYCCLSHNVLRIWIATFQLHANKFYYKLRCYTGIFIPEKSRNNTREKKYGFSSGVCDIANQLLTRHSPFAPLGHVDE